jgi:hypothetical protein
LLFLGQIPVQRLDRLQQECETSFGQRLGAQKT